jgi:hypothetical protein
MNEVNSRSVEGMIYPVLAVSRWGTYYLRGYKHAMARLLLQSEIGQV